MIDKFEGVHRFLSNFYTAPVELNSCLYPSVEHAYQAAKTTDPNDREWIRSSPTPAIAKKRGSPKGQNGRQIVMRRDWDKVKIRVMTILVTRKFVGTELAARLLATGDEVLIEGNWWGDRFWGVCDGEGQNWLGRILMSVRDKLRRDLK